MTAVAYIANEFPSPVEPYVIDEIAELRRRGVNVICCSGKRVAPNALSLAERAYWKETRFFQPLSDDVLLRSARRLASDRASLCHFLRPLLFDPRASMSLRVRTLGHTLMGSALAEELAPLHVDHIHAHHGYFASWMALVASRLLRIGFSFTLHGSDLLHRADLLFAKLQACRFCITVSDFNRNHILHHYPSMPAEKIIVQRLGVDRLLTWPGSSSAPAAVDRPLSLLAVGRLHRVKNYSFLITACSALRDQGVDFVCRIAGEGPERSALERQISEVRLQERVHILGHVPRNDLVRHYRTADLVVMTSQSEGIPVALMEAMSHNQLVLAPAITGIPELVENQRTGFLYQSGSLSSFMDAFHFIRSNRDALAGVRRAAGAKVAEVYNRQRNLRAFAEQFLARIPHSGGTYANPVLQQVRLSI